MEGRQGTLTLHKLPFLQAIYKCRAVEEKWCCGWVPIHLTERPVTSRGGGGSARKANPAAERTIQQAMRDGTVSRDENLVWMQCSGSGSSDSSFQIAAHNHKIVSKAAFDPENSPIAGYDISIIEENRLMTEKESLRRNAVAAFRRILSISKCSVTEATRNFIIIFSSKSKNQLRIYMKYWFIFSDFRKNIHLKYVCSVQVIERHEINLGHLDIFYIASFDNTFAFW